MDDLLFIIIILIGIWYWWDTQQSNEIALAACQRTCAKAGLQLLDATVARQRTWLRRGNNGSMQICRLYTFEFNNLSPDLQVSNRVPGEFGLRESGYIVLIGTQVVETNIPDDDTTRRVN